MAFRDTVFSEMNKSFISPLKQNVVKRDFQQISQISNIFVTNQNSQSSVKQGTFEKPRNSQIKCIKNQESLPLQQKQTTKGSGQFYVDKNQQSSNKNLQERKSTVKIDKSKDLFQKESFNDSKVYVPTHTKQKMSLTIRNSDSMRQLLENNQQDCRGLVTSKSQFLDIKNNSKKEVQAVQNVKYKFKHHLSLSGNQMFFSELTQIQESHQDQKNAHQKKKFSKGTFQNYSFYTENGDKNLPVSKENNENKKNTTFQHHFINKVGQYVDKVDIIDSKNKENMPASSSYKKSNKTINKKGIDKNQSFYMN